MRKLKACYIPTVRFICTLQAMLWEHTVLAINNFRLSSPFNFAAMATVLIIEDDETIRDGLQRLLTKEGFTTFFATNGAEGVRLAQTEVPTIIICDVAMPEMDGYQVLAAVRVIPQLAHTPFLFLSAKTADEDEQRGLTAGATAYLKKPMWPDDIITAIKKFV